MQEVQEDAYSLRKAMHEGFENLEIAMPQLKVAKILGQPDRKVIESEKEVWLYGVSEEGNCTVGSVRFDRGKVDLISNSRIGPDPALSKIEESELRTLLDALSRAPDANGRAFNPYDLVVVSNLLITAGETDAFLALNEYARINDDCGIVREKLLILSRCLHDSNG